MILVVGALGRLGGTIARQLLGDGRHVGVLVQSRSEYGVQATSSTASSTIRTGAGSMNGDGRKTRFALPVGLAIALSVGSAGCAGAPVAPSSEATFAPGSIVTSASPSKSPAITCLPIASPLMLPSEGRILFTTEPKNGNCVFFIDSVGLREIPTRVADTTLIHAVWGPSESIIFNSERTGPVTCSGLASTEGVSPS
jgi:hypothetical protein